MMKLKTVRAPCPSINVILDEYINQIFQNGLYGRTKAECVMWLLSDAVKQQLLDGKIKPIPFHFERHEEPESEK